MLDNYSANIFLAKYIYFNSLPKFLLIGTKLERLFSFWMMTLVLKQGGNHSGRHDRFWQKAGDKMKFITAIIKPFRLDDVREALTALGVEGLTVTEVRRYGRQKGHTEIYRGTEYAVNFLPKVKLEIAVSDNAVDKAVEAITAAAKTGQIGDGKIFVVDLIQAMRIRTGEQGDEAL